MNLVRIVKQAGRKFLLKYPSLASRILRKPKPKPAVVHNVFGHTLHQNPEDVAINFSPLEGLSPKRFPHGELGFFFRALQPGQVVLDIGANIGYFTLLFARGVGPKGHVYAFEPGPKSFKTLAKNIEVNGYQNVTLVNKAVSHTTGTTTLYICRSGESDNRITDTVRCTDSYDQMEMPTVKLDDFFLGNSCPIDLIKMDIQGAEYLALKGMTNLLARNPQVRLVLEYAPAGLELTVRTADFLAFIRGLGFRVFDLPERRAMREVNDAYLLRKYPPKAGKITNLLLQR